MQSASPRNTTPTSATEDRPALCELEHRVGALDSASVLPLAADDAFPPVLATSRMVALMEVAAARVMRPQLAPGQLSVGVGLNIEHLAATPLFETVRAVARHTGMQGKLHRFEVELHDRGGLVGRGTHTRAVVQEVRLLEGARRRVDGAGAPSA
jgi:fluoroacetyl-CoA thioesterase